MTGRLRWYRILFVQFKIKKVTPLKKNRLMLKATKDGNFSIKSSFVQLEGGNQNSVPFKMFWNPYVPTKVCFFAWKAWWG